MPFTKPRKIIQQGTRVTQPLASSVLEGTLYFVTDEGVIERSNLVTWDAWTMGDGTSLFVANDDDVIDLWRYVLSRLNVLEKALRIVYDEHTLHTPDIVKQITDVLEP